MAKKSISARLGKSLGGVWKYDPSMGSWYCDDGKRYVSRCCAGVDEFDNCIGPPQLWLYGDGVPRRAEGYAAEFWMSLRQAAKGGDGD